MSKLSEYGESFQYAKMQRRNGVLEIAFHTKSGSLQWSLDTHRECSLIFRKVSEDRENRVVILTGTGEEFTGPRATSSPTTHAHTTMKSPETWDEVVFDGRRLEHDLLSIEVPVIAAINGPAWRHMELALMSDIVLASDTARFEDRAHFAAGNLMPGDGMHLVLSTLMGWNRARYLQLMGNTLDAAEAKQLGLVAEVLPRDKVLARAWEIAEMLAKKPLLLLRYTRLIFTQEMKKRMHDHLALGLSLEGLAMLAQETQDKGFED